jgi:hypothetical protein
MIWASREVTHDVRANVKPMTIIKHIEHDLVAIVETSREIVLATASKAARSRRRRSHFNLATLATNAAGLIIRPRLNGVPVE